MEKRTLEIIVVCKGNTRYDSELGLVDAVKNYMSDTCVCKKEWYTEEKMERVLLEAFYDFIDVCCRPSFFLKKLERLKSFTPSLSARICMVFQVVEVCADDKYVNGFTADYEYIAETLRH